MRVKGLTGKQYFWTPSGVDWNAESKSKLQKKCKALLSSYWAGDVVAEEQNMPGTKMHFDFVNFSKKVIIEVMGGQHYKYNKFFHNKNIFNFVSSKNRDAKKKDFAELNGFLFIEVKTPEELNRYLLNQI